MQSGKILLRILRQEVGLISLMSWVVPGLYLDHLHNKQKQVFVGSVSSTPAWRTRSACWGYVRAGLEMTLWVTVCAEGMLEQGWKWHCESLYVLSLCIYCSNRRLRVRKPNINKKEANHTLAKAIALMLVNFLALVWLNPRSTVLTSLTFEGLLILMELLVIHRCETVDYEK